MNVIISVGGRFHAFNLAQQLHRRGFLARLITSYPKWKVEEFGVPREKVRSILLKEIIERVWRKLPSFLVNRYNFQPLINDLYDGLARRKVEKSDIFVGWSNFALQSMRKAKGLGAKTIVDCASAHVLRHDEILREEYEKFGIRYAGTIKVPHPRMIERTIKEYEEADYLCVPSLYVKRTFLEYGISEDKILYAPYGVDTLEFQGQPKKDKMFRVVFAGGMTLQKGVHYLLQAFAELNLPQAELMLVGSMADEMKGFFEKYEGHYSYVGHVPQRELYRYYSQGSVFVLNSIQDGFGMVIIQAMACGLPVIATTNTGGRDVIRDGKDGFIIPIRDIDALKEKILYLYKHRDQCEHMGEQAKERVAHGFTWDDYGDRIVSGYEKVLASVKAK